MKTWLSLGIVALFGALFLAGCSGMSEEEAKKVDLQATPTKPPTSATGPGGQQKPGPGTKVAEAK